MNLDNEHHRKHDNHEPSYPFYYLKYLDFSNETGVPPCEEHDILECDDSAIGKVSDYVGELPAGQCRERLLSESVSMSGVSV
jgi:hypothetical protein